MKRYRLLSAGLAVLLLLGSCSVPNPGSFGGGDAAARAHIHSGTGADAVQRPGKSAYGRTHFRRAGKSAPHCRHAQ